MELSNEKHFCNDPVACEHDLNESISGFAKSNLPRMESLRKIVSEKNVMEVEGVLVDMQTAKAIVMVYDAISEENKKNFLTKSIGEMGRIAWKLVK
jgi:hypothetical protein